MVSAALASAGVAVFHLFLRRNSKSSRLTSATIWSPWRATVQASPPRATALAISLKCTLKCDALTVVSVMRATVPGGSDIRPAEKKIFFFGAGPEGGEQAWGGLDVGQGRMSATASLVD